jgi:hypothetical protein
MEDIVKIVQREIVAKMDTKLELIDVDGGTLTVCSVKWARKGKYILNEANETFQIVGVDYTENKIYLQDAFVGEKAFLYLPILVHGTPKETNEEWTKNPTFELDKLPVIWLVEPLEERPFGRESALERESDLRCVFFDSRDGTQWVVKNIHDERTQSLLNMVDAFEKSMRSNRIFKKNDSARVRNLNKLGTENLGSFEKNIINADLTAIDYRVTASIYRGNKCEC